MRKAFVQAAKSGMPANRNCYAAYEGFLERGVEVGWFFPGEQTDSAVRLPDGIERETIVHGTIPIVHRALRELGVEPPAAEFSWPPDLGNDARGDSQRIFVAGVR